jgi:hypothetical protein
MSRKRQRDEARDGYQRFCGSRVRSGVSSHFPFGGAFSGISGDTDGIVDLIDCVVAGRRLERARNFGNNLRHRCERIGSFTDSLDWFIFYSSEKGSGALD